MRSILATIGIGVALSTVPVGLLAIFLINRVREPSPQEAVGAADAAESRGEGRELRRPRSNSVATGRTEPADRNSAPSLPTARPAPAPRARVPAKAASAGPDPLPGPAPLTVESLRESLLDGAPGSMPLEELFDTYSSTAGPRRRQASLVLLLRKSETLPHLIELLAGGGDDPRIGALLFLQKVEPWPEASAAVLDLLHDPRTSRNVFLRALATAAALDLEEAIPVAAESLRTSASSDLREVAARVLGLLAGSSRETAGVPETLEAALSDASPGVAVAAAAALGKLGSEAGLSLLLRLGEEGDWALRRRAVLALGEVGTQSTVGGQLEAIARSDESPAVRNAAAMALHALNSRDLAPTEKMSYLLECMESPNPEVAVWAADRLWRLDPEEARFVFRERLPTAPPHLRWVFMLNLFR